MFARLFVALVLFWVVTYLVGLFDWGLGGYRALVLLATLAATWILVRNAKSKKIFSPFNANILLAIMIAFAVAWHLFSFYEGFVSPTLIDIATRTLASGQMMLAGRNPYSLSVDLLAAPYTGFKYGPLMAIIFLPLGGVFGSGGIVATNLILDLIVASLTYLLGARFGAKRVGLFSTLLYLSTPFLPFEIYHVGSTDLAALIPLLAALLLVERSEFAGGLVGLSISTKLIPGLLFVISCLPRTGRLRYFGGLAVGLLPLLFYMIISPADLVSNLILFPMTRPVDATSWMYGLPSEFRLISDSIFIITLLLAFAYVSFKNVTLIGRCGIATVCMLVAILTGAVMHRNYQLWWVPFFAVVLAMTTWTIRLGSPQNGVVSSLIRGRRHHANREN